VRLRRAPSGCFYCRTPIRATVAWEEGRFFPRQCSDHRPHGCPQGTATRCSPSCCAAVLRPQADASLHRRAASIIPLYSCNRGCCTMATALHCLWRSALRRCHRGSPPAASDRGRLRAPIAAERRPEPARSRAANNRTRSKRSLLRLKTAPSAHSMQRSRPNRLVAAELTRGWNKALRARFGD